MTVIGAADRPTAARVADALSDRTVRTTETIATARELFDEDPAAVLVAAGLPDGDGTDLLAAIRTGDRCDPATPVIRLLDSDATVSTGAEPDAGVVSDPGAAGGSIPRMPSTSALGSTIRTRCARRSISPSPSGSTRERSTSSTASAGAARPTTGRSRTPGGPLANDCEPSSTPAATTRRSTAS